ncbi:MAG: hypothetical protein LBI34_02470 [Puniceicoccales bacterium]|jgi:hypothetical protein|nr:hypothetical protein [Puniceicoccales bacterium]
MYQPISPSAHQPISAGGEVLAAEPDTVTASGALASAKTKSTQPNWSFWNVIKFCVLWIFALVTLGLSFFLYSTETRNFLFPSSSVAPYLPGVALPKKEPEDLRPVLPLPHITPPSAESLREPCVLALTRNTFCKHVEEIIVALEKCTPSHAVGLHPGGMQKLTDACKMVGGELLSRFNTLENSGQIRDLSIFTPIDTIEEIIKKEHPDMTNSEISDFEGKLSWEQKAALLAEYFASDGELSRQGTIYRNTCEWFVANNLKDNPLAVSMFCDGKSTFRQYVGVYYDRKSETEIDWSTRFEDLINDQTVEIIYGNTHICSSEQYENFFLDGRNYGLIPDFARLYGIAKSVILFKPWVASGKPLPSPDQAIRTAKSWLTQFSKEGRPEMDITFADFMRVLFQVSRSDGQELLLAELRKLYFKMIQTDSKSKPGVPEILCCPPRMDSATSKNFVQWMQLLESKNFSKIFLSDEELLRAACVRFYLEEQCPLRISAQRADKDDTRIVRDFRKAFRKTCETSGTKLPNSREDIVELFLPSSSFERIARRETFGVLEE